MTSPSATTSTRASGCNFSAASLADRTTSTDAPRRPTRAIAPSNSGVSRATTTMIWLTPAETSKRA
ncbi:hypothetical protein [Sphingomonas aliaeris]|uniref:hypothetical protein n=1 Tax=Sphingomonas aliaeris TaxID=2759526 RepID=UPI001CECC210|nr:hypothetical protein [Sphingomonas aliaeris]